VTDASSADGWQLQVDRYVAGECTPAEAMAVRGWMAADPARRALVEELVRRHRVGTPAVVPPLPPPSPPDPRAVAQAFDLLERRIARSTRKVGAFSDPRPQGVGEDARRRLVPWAASILIILAAGGTIEVLRHGSVAATGRATGREYVTAAGQRLSVTLVDGTQVTLAPASRVRVAAGYGSGGARRELELEGEAYFAVVRDAARPFAVRAHGAVARDVGTAFDVRAYPENAGARIAVVEGEVALSPLSSLPSRAAQLRAGDVATANAAGVTVTHDSDIQALTAWRSGMLVFTDTPLRQAIAELSRWYALDVRLADSAADARVGGRTVRGTFTTEAPSIVLAAMTHAVGARYVQRGTHVVVFTDAGAR
jgi:transmembrane sensor